MTPDECAGCRFFDGVDMCEVQEGRKGAIFPQPRDGIVACFAKIEGVK